MFNLKYNTMYFSKYEWTYVAAILKCARPKLNKMGHGTEFSDIISKKLRHNVPNGKYDHDQICRYNSINVNCRNDMA